MTKHAKILNPYGAFTVPRSLEALQGHPRNLCRQPSAILIYRDLMWLADDGKPPVHLEHLTPQLASQVTQVSALHIDTFRSTQQVIRSLPPPEEPDYEPPLELQLKPTRKEQAHMVAS